jgi:hypothetical protein
MIDFTLVSREVRSLVARRRELLTFLGSVFAALGIVLQNVLQGNLPGDLRDLREHVFAVYGFMLMVPSLILALRLARLNAGMVLNGVLYQRLMQEQDFTTKSTPERIKKAARLNYFGVSFLMFLLTDLIAGFSATLLALALGIDVWPAILPGAAVVLGGLAVYHYYHNRAADFAWKRIGAEPCTPFDRDHWEAHQSGSLEDINHDMITILGLVGLMVFSGFEMLSGLGGWLRAVKEAGDTTDLSQEVIDHAPTVYSVLMATTCLMGLLTYLRLRLGLGTFSMLIDPTDRPFRPLRLTDSLLGYLLLTFLLVVSLHVLLYPHLKNHAILLSIDALVFVLAVAVEQVALVLAGKRLKA